MGLQDTQSEACNWQGGLQADLGGLKRIAARHTLRTDWQRRMHLPSDYGAVSVLGVTGKRALTLSGPRTACGYDYRHSPRISSGLHKAEHWRTGQTP